MKGFSMVSFQSELLSTGGTTTGIIVPPDLVEALGGGRKPKVVASVNGYTWRTSVAFMDGDFWLGVSSEHREKGKLKAGDAVSVSLALDTAPREVAVPDDLATALAASPDARGVFEALSYSRKRQIVLGIEGAKTAETRARRIEKTIAVLTEG